ncbi:Riboflavin transporter MCH5 [Elsinoe australis]|uniref:Riboflavin transporter MCH5 n=1 Tax=Elsinoe australis TaxID=40998 RepID=A0A2P7YFW8_9PEZI|nr:Riboflavin transporter MCH5 [Elsinoe australis]
MATSTITLESLATSHEPTPRTQSGTSSTELNIRSEPAVEPDFATSAIPDGGYGWIVVLCGSITTFWINALLNCWGVLQTALLTSTMANVPASTVSFVGSLCLACGVAFGLLATRMARSFGTRPTAMAGVTLISAGLVSAGFCTTNIPGMFVSIGVIAGVGMSLVYTITNLLPVQYFSGKIGLANGLVKLGGGIGGCVMAVALQALVNRVGIAWTFRIQGLMTFAVGLPAAWFMKDRVPLRGTPFVDLSMFRNRTFTTIFAAAAIGTFTLFVPPFYLPLFAQTLGLSASTGAALVAAFNLCNAIGRFCSGPLCDRIGPINTFLGTMALNAFTMLAIWPISNKMAPLVVFAIFNGLANGSFFTTVPTVVASIFGPGRAAVAMSMSITGWTVGYLMGSPIAGYLLQAGGGNNDASRTTVAAFRPAIFYSGGISLLSTLLVCAARLGVKRRPFQKV